MIVGHRRKEDGVSLEGRVAIVTGGAQGIGRAIARRFAADQARLVVADLNLEAANQIADELRFAGNEAVAVQVDVCSRAATEEMAKAALDAFGQIDILVCNAGILGPIKATWELGEDEWDSVLGVNLKGVFLSCRAVLPAMIERRTGAIVSLASVAGKEANAKMVAYSASKGGVIALTKSIAKEVVEYGIRVNCVSPALIETAMAGQMGPGQAEFLATRIPMGRMGRPEEVAAVVHFLATDNASFVTGQCYDVSGGRSDY
ncbi:MAG: SDR family oxidoreductase [Chloroflexi bacterium]|nr:SDR family oxidoreductase [Chloroflexota bacterium]